PAGPLDAVPLLQVLVVDLLGRHDPMHRHGGRRIDGPSKAGVDGPHAGAGRVAGREGVADRPGGGVYAAGERAGDSSARGAGGASRGKVAPKVTPGIAAATSPFTLRTPSGASALGSKVSIWLAPPARNRSKTALSRTNPGAEVEASARALASGVPVPPRASE